MNQKQLFDLRHGKHVKDLLHQLTLISKRKYLCKLVYVICVRKFKSSSPFVSLSFKYTCPVHFVQKRTLIQLLISYFIAESMYIAIYIKQICHDSRNNNCWFFSLSIYERIEMLRGTWFLKEWRRTIYGALNIESLRQQYFAWYSNWWAVNTLIGIII